MITALFNNIYILVYFVNTAKYIFIGIISDNNSMLNFELDYN